MKTVFTSSELPHVWIHKKAPHGRAPSAMSFDGAEFRSYAAVIAKWHIAPTGEKVVLLNNFRYSNTTTGHQSTVRRACSHLVTLSAPVKDLSSPVSFLRACLAQAEERFKHAKDIEAHHPRRKSVISAVYAEAFSLYATARKTAEVFAIKGEIPESKAEEQQSAQDAVASYFKAAQAKREKKEKEALKKWLAGEFVHTASLPEGKTFFRIVVFPDTAATLQSSKGVSMPLDEAKRGLAFILSKRKTGWRKNGERFPIAGYELDSISDSGIVAGCHRFDWQEVRRVLRMIKDHEEESALMGTNATQNG